MTQPGTIAYETRTLAKAVIGIVGGVPVASSQFGIKKIVPSYATLAITIDVSGIDAPDVFGTIAQIQPNVFLLSSANQAAQFVQTDVGPNPGEFVLTVYNHQGQAQPWNSGAVNGLWFSVSLIEGPIFPANLP